jgi:hypothetical protein
MNHESEIPLSDWALSQGLSYNKALRLVLTRKVLGRKLDGHWLVSPNKDCTQPTSVAR